MNIYIKDKTNVDYIPLKKSKVVIVSAIVLISMLLVSYLITPAITNAVEKIPVIINKNRNEFSVDKLKKEIEGMNIQHKDIVLAQSILETGSFSSPVFKNNHNLFGMKVASTRPTTALGTELNHAYYKDWKSSLIDYALWQTSFARKLNEEQYLDLLNSIYAEDNSYKEKLIKIIYSIRNQRIKEN